MKFDDHPTEKERRLAESLATRLDSSELGPDSASNELAPVEGMVQLIGYTKLEHRLDPARNAALRAAVLGHAQGVLQKRSIAPWKRPLRWAWLFVPVAGVYFFVAGTSQLERGTQLERKTESEVTSKTFAPLEAHEEQPAIAQAALGRVVRAQAAALAERVEEGETTVASHQLDQAWQRYRGSLLAELEKP